MKYRELIGAACKAMGLSAAETGIVLYHRPRNGKSGYRAAVRCYRAILRSHGLIV